MKKKHFCCKVLFFDMKYTQEELFFHLKRNYNSNLFMVLNLLVSRIWSMWSTYEKKGDSLKHMMTLHGTDNILGFYWNVTLKIRALRKMTPSGQHSY